MSRLCFIVATLLFLAPAHGQTPSSSGSSNSAKPFAYDVVSIRPHPNDDGSSVQPTKDGIRIVNVPLYGLITNAYQVRWDCISGGPGWAASDGYDLCAKMDDENVAALDKFTPKERSREQMKMLAAVLNERFHLKVRQIQKEMPAYQLVLAKSGSKIKVADGSNQYENGIQGANHKPMGAGAMRISYGEIVGQSIGMDIFALNLGGTLDRPVLNKTGLTGKYDITLRWTPEGAGTEQDNTGGIFTALEEQMGLKLENIKQMADCIVIESAERPTPN
jgi:uncharacterized protein (TIGR03435 family)